MFLLAALVVVIFCGLVSYHFKSVIDPDMGLFKSTRQKALRSRVINWGIIYVLAVTVWWYWQPIQKFVAERRAEQFIQQNRPK